MRKMLKACLLMGSLVAMTGCWRIGPEKLAADRLSYTTVIGNSWKEQMLLNLVKIRYGDVPVFMGVQTMLAQYTLMGQVTMGGGFNGNSLPTTPYSWLGNVTGNVQYQDRPTISYAPMSSSKFGKKLMTPLSTSVLMGLLQSGYPIKTAFRMTVHSIGGLENMFAFKSDQAGLDAEFFQLLDVMTDLQKGGVLMPSIREDTAVLRLLPTENPGLHKAIDEFRRILGLNPEINEYSVVYGAVQDNPDHIVIVTRSMLDLMSDLSGYIEVPEEDARMHRAFPSRPATSVSGHPLPALLRIHSGTSKSGDYFVSIPYRSQKFWIDNQDIDSKVTFSSLMFLFNLVDSNKEEGSSPRSANPASTAASKELKKIMNRKEMYDK